jgi:membrane associated rhomboid family serine protease
MIPLRDNVPTRTFPVVTVGLIIANCAVWVWELSKPGLERHVLQAGYYPCSIDPPCHVPVEHLPWYESAFTSMFMHGSWQHIIGNMLFLWIFGNNVEEAMGRIRFLLWYVAAGLAATATQTAVTLIFSRDSASIPNIGASGAIAGVLGAYFVLLPRARVLTAIFFGIILFREIPAAWFLGVWIALQLWEGGFSILQPQPGGGTAFFAHIGGFVFGLATVHFVAGRRRQPPPRTLYI